jgi:lipoprotein-anchoring transpeptidase ErfK/SrfK
MHVALKQLSALYLTAAAAYTGAFMLSHHPALADRAGEASMLVRANGAEATTAVDTFVVQPALRFAGSESTSLGRKLVAALESPFEHASAVRGAHVQHAMQRLAANNAPAHFRVTPSTQMAPPSSPSDDQELRPSEGGDGFSAGTPNALSQSDPSQSQQPTRRGNAVGTSSAGEVAQTDSSQYQIAPQAGVSTLPSNLDNGTSAAVPQLPPPTAAEITQVEQRLKDNLTSEMINNFELFLYVSKASSGPWSQRMFVFQKQASGDLNLAYSWPVSTGREKVEYNATGQKLPSFTPAGYYELDPHRFYTHYTSGQWGEPMPFAMFFNWQKDGEATGLAIHSASGDDVAQLGTRASAGCIRLPPDAAQTLFSLIKSKYRGLAPKFAIDRRTGTMSNDGILVHDAQGHVQLADGYRVLVFIEDYGGENVVAAMY